MPHAIGIRNARYRHGHNGRDGKSLTYTSWDNMIGRCHNPGANGYEQYGARGIVVCERWRSYGNFLADVGERPSKRHSIDRLDNHKGYEPGNVRWATAKEQIRNSSKVKAVIRSDGKRYDAVIDAAIDVGVDYACIVKVCRGQRKTAGGFRWSYADGTV